MIDLGWKDQEIEVRVPNRLLSKDEFDEYLVRSNKNTGDWDFDILSSNFDFDQLVEWGFDDKELKAEFDLDLEDIGQNEEDDIDGGNKIIVEVEVENIDSQKELYEELIVRGYKCKLLTL